MNKVKERLKAMIGHYVLIEYVDQANNTGTAEGELKEVNDEMIVLKAGPTTRILTNIIISEIWDLGKDNKN